MKLFKLIIIQNKKFVLFLVKIGIHYSYIMTTIGKILFRRGKTPQVIGVYGNVL